MLDAIDARGRFDDDLMPGSIWIDFNAFNGSDQKPLWINPIETGSHHRLPNFHVLARGDVFQLATIIIETANLSHRTRVLKHRTHAGMFVSDHLYHREIWAYRYYSTDDSTARCHWHVPLYVVESSEIQRQATKPKRS